jgi:hypothetical protein
MVTLLNRISSAWDYITEISQMKALRESMPQNALKMAEAQASWETTKYRAELILEWAKEGYKSTFDEYLASRKLDPMPLRTQKIETKKDG